MNKKILITGIGGPTPRSIAIALRKKYPNARLIGIDSSARALGFHMKNLVDKHLVAPRADDPDYWNFVKNLIKQEQIDIAFVQPEVEVIEWGKYIKIHGNYPCKVLLPPLILAEYLVDKAKMSEVLKGTQYIPKTIKVTQENPCFSEVEKQIGFPCWIRATKGSGGLGSLKIMDISSLKSWLFIHNDIKEFTVSEFLTGRHLANQMLYYKGELLKNAALECVEYVMASVAPSKVTGNTSYGRFLNENRILEFCHSCMEYVCEKLDVVPHGVLSFDLKEDDNGNMKVTEINIRHMAYTGIMAEVGFDLISDTVTLLNDGSSKVEKIPLFNYEKDWAFLRDVDIEPIIIEESQLRSRI